MASPFLPQVSCLNDIIFNQERGGGEVQRDEGSGGQMDGGMEGERRGKSA